MVGRFPKRSCESRLRRPNRSSPNWPNSFLLRMGPGTRIYRTSQGQFPRSMRARAFFSLKYGAGRISKRDWERTQMCSNFTILSILVSATVKPILSCKNCWNLLVRKRSMLSQRIGPGSTFDREDLLQAATALHLPSSSNKISGDPVNNLEWRFRGPRFSMEWRKLAASRFATQVLKSRYDMSVPPRTVDLVGVEELGLEIRVSWRDK